MTKKTLLLGTLFSFLVIGCGDDSSEAHTKPEKEKAADPAPKPESEKVAQTKPPEATKPVRIKPKIEKVEKPIPEIAPNPNLTETPESTTPPTTPKKPIPEALIGLFHRANTGDAEAQFHLAQAYENGTKVEKDLEEAARWLRMSAEQGNRTAAYNLAMLLDTGHGVKMNKEEAQKWYAEANKNPDDSVNKVPNN